MNNLCPLRQALVLLMIVASVTVCSCGGRADLAPLLAAAGDACPDGRLERVTVEVVNKGRRASRATTTSIFFPAFEVRLPTRPLRPGDSHLLSTALPGACQPDGCRLTILVDAKNEVRESNEDNNRDQGVCRRPGAPN